MLEAGEIIEQGTRKELYAKDERYRQLHDRQYAWEANTFVNPGEDYVPSSP